MLIVSYWYLPIVVKNVSLKTNGYALSRYFSIIYTSPVSSCRILGHALCIKKSQMFEVHGINIQLGYFVLTK